MCLNNKSFMTKRKAFTLIELLIVIAIIGILFIVLVSKVDFATDKAKATGVQTDFRSFQMAFDTVAKENAGFNTFGWDTGDANQNGKRDSYDEGDNGAGGGIAHNGIQDGAEVFTGHKVYAETFSKVYSLKKNGTGSYDREALNRLETAINANLDPKLHITIKDDGEILMANGARDPWNKEYHGYYITNAEVDGKDRGAIVMYSDGANNEFGSEHIIANGIVTISIPGSNKAGKDDYSIVSLYTYVNGYGEVKNITTGFSNNQTFLAGENANSGGTVDNVVPPQKPDITELLEPGLYEAGAIALAGNGDVETAKSMVKTLWPELLSTNIAKVNKGSFYMEDQDVIGDLVLPNDGSITSISYRAFYKCTGLTSITIPDSVTSIGDDAFYNCTGLAAVYISDIAKWCGIGLTDYDAHPLDYAKLYLNGELVTDLIIPDGVTSIGNMSFRNCTSLTSVVIPDSVTSIGDYAFYKCSGLTSIVIGDSVESIGDDAFYNCTSLTDVVIPDGVTSIGYEAFYNCESLTRITIPDSVTSIGNGVFRDCSGLASVTISDNLTNINRATFAGCTSLTSVTIPDSVTSIEGYAFEDCSSLESVTIHDSVMSIGEYAFAGCSSLTSVVIPDSVTSLGYYAFWKCSGLTSVIISDNLTNIDNATFAGCKGLTSIIIPDSVTSIGTNAFSDCKGLTSVTIGNGVTKIGSRAFISCENLTNVIIGDSVTSIDGSAFSYCYGLTSIVIPDSITSIGGSAFYMCTGLTSITIPDSVTSIATGAFAHCYSLASIVIPDSVTSIDSAVFYGCSSLTSITIPDSITNIGQSALKDCRDLQTITFKGTIAQWHAIEKGSEWNIYSSITAIICSDGVVSIT